MKGSELLGATTPVPVTEGVSWPSRHHAAAPVRPRPSPRAVPS